MALQEGKEKVANTGLKRIQEPSQNIKYRTMEEASGFTPWLGVDCKIPFIMIFYSWEYIWTTTPIKQ
jgi:hypothetical protein